LAPFFIRFQGPACRLCGQTCRLLKEPQRPLGESEILHLGPETLVMSSSLRSGTAELDHLFLVVPDEKTATTMMEDAGLRVNYRRVHPGQGTTNVCACLDDVFIELLWLDGSEISDATEAITLSSRARGKGSPIGISWRGLSPFENQIGGTTPYFAPFMPEGVSIPVATASLDPRLPFVFRTPGGTPPIKRADGLVGERQTPELATLGCCELVVPNADSVQELLAPFELISVRSGDPALKLTLLRPDKTVGLKVDWAI